MREGLQKGVWPRLKMVECMIPRGMTLKVWNRGGGVPRPRQPKQKVKGVFFFSALDGPSGSAAQFCCSCTLFHFYKEQGSWYFCCLQFPRTMNHNRNLKPTALNKQGFANAPIK